MKIFIKIGLLFLALFVIILFFALGLSTWCPSDINKDENQSIVRTHKNTVIHKIDSTKSIVEMRDSLLGNIKLNSSKTDEDEIEYKLINNHRHDLIKGIKPPKIKIAGHLGKEIITDNYTGTKIDTIWLEEYEFDIDNISYPMYKAKSNIPNFPEIEMYWRSSGTAYLVNEGDLDGDGKEEWGWMIGNHQGHADLEYHIVRYNRGYWEELVNENGDPYNFSGDERHSGIDFFSKGPKKGAITISHYCWPEEPGPQREVKDTIWKPIWNKINLN